MDTRGLFLLRESRRVGSETYRGIVELVSRFGFISIEEVMYRFDFPAQKALDRLKYLTRVGLLERFESFTIPQSFYCLSPLGIQMAEAHRVSDEIHAFRPSQYFGLNQRHDRMLVRIYLALRKIFGVNFKGWMGERTIRQNGNFSASPIDPAGLRILDGLFQLEIEKERIDPHEATAPIVTKDLWWCGLELELTLKSAARYRKQFSGLAATVYDALGKTQKVPLVLFLYGTDAIGRTLRKYWSEQQDRYGQCLFVFGPADRFLKERGTTPLVRCLGPDTRDILAAEMNRVKLKMGVSQ